MASNSGIDAIKKAAAAKRNAGGVVANALSNSASKKRGGTPPSMSNAITRRLAKKDLPNDHDEDD